MRGSDDEEEIGVLPATRQLLAYIRCQSDYATVKRLLEAKADPTWHGRSFGAYSAVFYAINAESVEVLRLMYASWPNLETPEFESASPDGNCRHTLMGFAAEALNARKESKNWRDGKMNKNCILLR